MAHLIELPEVVTLNRRNKGTKKEVTHINSRPGFFDPSKILRVSRHAETDLCSFVQFEGGGSVVIAKMPDDLVKILKEANNPHCHSHATYPSASEITPEPKEEDFKLRHIRVAYQGATTKELVYDVFTDGYPGFIKVGELRKYHDSDSWAFYGTVGIQCPEFGGHGFLHACHLEELAKLMRNGDIKRFAEPILKVAV